MSFPRPPLPHPTPSRLSASAPTFIPSSLSHPPNPPSSPSPSPSPSPLSSLSSLSSSPSLPPRSRSPSPHRPRRHRSPNHVLLTSSSVTLSPGNPSSRLSNAPLVGPSPYSPFAFRRENLRNTDQIRELAMNIDHVIELQLVKTAFNCMDHVVDHMEILGVSRVLNTKWNLEIVTKTYNSAKAKLVQGVLKGMEENCPDSIARYLHSRVYGSFGWEQPWSGWRTGAEIFREMRERLKENWFSLQAYPELRNNLLDLFNVVLETAENLEARPLLPTSSLAGLGSTTLQVPKINSNSLQVPGSSEMVPESRQTIDLGELLGVAPQQQQRNHWGRGSSQSRSPSPQRQKKKARYDGEGRF